MKKEKGSVYIQEISYPKKKEAKLKIELIRFLSQPNQKCSNLIIPNEALRVLNNYCFFSYDGIRQYGINA